MQNIRKQKHQRYRDSRIESEYMIVNSIHLFITHARNRSNTYTYALRSVAMAIRLPEYYFSLT